MPPSTTAHVFLDANTTLHFKRADQIDWPKLTGAATVILVAAPVFLRELEKNKVHNPSRRLRERAAAAARWYSALTEKDGPIALAKDVTLSFIEHEPLIDFAANMLSRDISDDHLIASALEYHAQHHVDAKIATADLPLRAKLRSHPIKALTLPDELRLPDEPDPVEVELENTRAELHRLKHRLPKLALAFKGGDRHCKVILPAKPRVPTIPTLDEMKAKHPFYPTPQTPPQPPRQNPGGGVKLSSLTSAGIHAARAERYNTDLARFFEEYEAFYGLAAQWLDAYDRRFETTFILSNDGTMPATDNHVVIDLPEGVAVYTSNEFPAPPKEPKAPLPPDTSALELMQAHQLDPADSLYRTSMLSWGDRGDRDGMAIIDKGRRRVTYPVATLKHEFYSELGPLFIQFEDWAAIRSFGVKVNLSSGDLPDSISAELHFIVERGSHPRSSAKKVRE
ncbi:MAG: PIN domain-containing protein [Planctomycetes bacterium]|nr:PIN domain-containing protein [Planctomycetota bacterium]